MTHADVFVGAFAGREAMTPEERANEVVFRHLDRQRIREQWEGDIADAIRAAVAEEREACAATCESLGNPNEASEFAAAIRERATT